MNVKSCTNLNEKSCTDLEKKLNYGGLCDFNRELLK